MGNATGVTEVTVGSLRMRRMAPWVRRFGESAGRTLLDDPRREAEAHLIEQAAERPPISAEIVAGLVDHLGRHVLGGAADGEVLRAVGHADRETKINQFDGARRDEHHVLRLAT